jgi:hypothetical protein
VRARLEPPGKRLGDGDEGDGAEGQVEGRHPGLAPWLEGAEGLDEQELTDDEAAHRASEPTALPGGLAIGA